MSRALSSLLVALSAWGCGHDPAHDRPIEPWASPNVPPTTQIGDDGGGWTDGVKPAAVDAGTTK